MSVYLPPLLLAAFAVSLIIHDRIRAAAFTREMERNNADFNRRCREAMDGLGKDIKDIKP